jgi:histidine triad (HIT) family protein
MELDQLTIFEKIIKRIVKSKIIYETETIIVIEDIKPLAPIHYLIISKELFKHCSYIPVEKMFIIQDMFLAVQYLANNILYAKEYKLIINNGSSAGQCVFHLHMHFLSGFIKSC